MKKTIISIVVLTVLASVFAFAGIAYAQSTNPPAQTPEAGYGRGMMGAGRGMMGNYAAGADQDGQMHDEMIAAYAEKLGISVEDINARLAKGETMLQIAASKGLTTAQFQSLMSEVHAKAVAEAVKNGDLTQEQADWMNQRGGMMSGGRGGMMNGAGRGMRGAGGTGTNPCPFNTQTNP
jgi:hypothetical protein